MELQPVESLISCCLNFPLRRQPSPVSRIHSSSPPSLYKRQALTRPDLFLQPLLQAPLPPWCLVSLVPHLSGGYSCEIYSPETQRIESSSGQKYEEKLKNDLFSTLAAFPNGGAVTEPRIC